MHSIVGMNSEAKKNILTKYLLAALIIMCVIFLLCLGIATVFNSRDLFMDSESFEQQITVMNMLSDAVNESHSFMSTEYKGADGNLYTESIVLGKFEPELIEGISGICSEGLKFNGYVFFTGKDGELKNQLYVKEYKDKLIENCFEGTETNQSIIVNSLIEGIDAEGILLSDSVNNMRVKLADDVTVGNVYGNELYVNIDVSFKSKWALFGRENTKRDTKRIMNRVRSIRVPYLDGYFFAPVVSVGRINNSDNVVTWEEYYSEYDAN